MQIAKPVFLVISSAAILLAVGMIANSSNAQSNQARQRNNQQQSSTRIALEYATLTTERVEQNGRTTYQVIWEFNDFIRDGQSTRSIEDAYRKLTGKLGSTTSSVSNVSTMLNSIGRQGWELIETSGDGSVTTQIFMRRG